VKPDDLPSDETYIADLQRVAEIVGHTPTLEEYDQHGRFSSRPFTKRFGTWAGAHERAGLEPRPGHNEGVAGTEPRYADLSPEDVGLSPVGEES